MRSLYLDTASGEAPWCCQRVLLFSAGRFPRSSNLMPPLRRSSSRTSSTSWKNTPNRKSDTRNKSLAPAEGWVERSIPGNLGRSWLGARSVWQRPYFVAQKFVVKKRVAGTQPSPVASQPSVTSSPALLLVQPGRHLSSPCAGLADSSLFSNERYTAWLCSASPSPHSHLGSLGRTPSMVGAPQPWCLASSHFILRFQHSLSYRPAELLIHTVPKPPAAARPPWLCRWSCWEQPGMVREHSPAGARAAEPPLTQSAAYEVPSNPC